MAADLAPAVRLAPAKLNLTLAVVGRRPDGFHALHSVMVPLALADRLSFAVLPDGPDTLHVSGFDAGPPDENLVLRAIAGTRAALGRAVASPPLAARLEKRIPVAAGLAGGSSDAAAAMDAALEAWGTTLDAPALLALAASLGSDVPFFLAGGPALIEGRGERVTHLHGLRAGSPPPGVLLVTAAMPLTSRDVFAAWSAGAMSDPGVARRTSEHFASEFGSGLTTTSLLERAGVLASANDLLPAASVVLPELVSLRRGLMRLLGRPVGLSGSGPTLWALYPSPVDAGEAAGIVEGAVGEGSLPAPGGPPFIAATTFAATAAQPEAPPPHDPHRPTDDPARRTTP